MSPHLFLKSALCLSVLRYAYLRYRQGQRDADSTSPQTDYHIYLHLKIKRRPTTL